MKKSSKGLNNLFITTEPNNPRNTTTQRIRYKGKINRSKHTFSAKAMENYNNLPAEMKSKDITTLQFKNKLKRYLKTNLLLEKH